MNAIVGNETQDVQTYTVLGTLRKVIYMGDMFQQPKLWRKQMINRSIPKKTETKMYKRAEKDRK